MEVIERLIQAGGEVNEQDEKDGSTPLHAASREGHVEVVNILIQAGGEVNYKTEQGNTPLHQASWKGHVEVVNTLIKTGGEVNTQRRDGHLIFFSALFNTVKLHEKERSTT